SRGPRPAERKSAVRRFVLDSRRGPEKDEVTAGAGPIELRKAPTGLRRWVILFPVRTHTGGLMEFSGSGYYKPRGEDSVPGEMAMRITPQNHFGMWQLQFMVSEARPFGWTGPKEETRSENVIHLTLNQAKQLIEAIQEFMASRAQVEQ